MTDKNPKHRYKAQEETEDSKRPVLSIVPKPGEKTPSQIWQELANKPETFSAEGLYTPGQLNGWFQGIANYREPLWKVSLRGADERLDLYLSKGESVSKWPGDAPYFILGAGTTRPWKDRPLATAFASADEERQQYLHLAEEQLISMFEAGDVKLEGHVADLEHVLFDEKPFMTPELSFNQFLFDMYAKFQPQGEASKPFDEHFSGKIFRITDQLPGYLYVAYEMHSPLVEISLSSQSERMSVFIDKSNKTPKVVGASSKRTQTKKEELARQGYKLRSVLRELGQDMFDLARNSPIILEGHALQSLPNDYTPLRENSHGVESTGFFMNLCRSYDEHINFRKKALAPLKETSAPQASWLKRVYNAVRRQKSKQ